MSRPGINELFRVFLRIGLLSFGGPAAQIALMHRMIVDEKKWLTEKQYLNALNFCMLLPGPEAMQLATYAGWRLRGVTGGLLAGSLFVLPGALVILVLALVYVSFGNLPVIDAVFLGIKAAVIVIVVEALLRVAKRSLATHTEWLVALAAFIAIFFFNIPYPLIIAIAALFGFLSAGRSTKQSGTSTSVPLPDRESLLAIFTLLFLWIGLLLLLKSSDKFTFLSQVADFFSVLAVVTFGGAYAVLAYMAQDVVSNFGWLTTGEMMDGLGLAETTPGPLILVTEFVAFIAGYKEHGLLSAVAAAFVVLWVTFIPCFIWIFAGAPYIDWLSEYQRLKNSLTMITAVVVGVILNLSLWFALHVLFSVVDSTRFGPLRVLVPSISTINLSVVVIALISAVVLFRFHWSIPRMMLLAAGMGLVASLLTV